MFYAPQFYVLSLPLFFSPSLYTPPVCMYVCGVINKRKVAINSREMSGPGKKLKYGDMGGVQGAKEEGKVM